MLPSLQIKRRVVGNVSPDESSEQESLNVRQHTDCCLLTKERVSDFLLLLLLIRCDNGLPCAVTHPDFSRLANLKIFLVDLFQVDEIQHHPIAEIGPEFFHNVQCKTGTTRPQLMEESHLGVEPRGLQRRTNIVRKDCIQEGKKRVCTVKGRPL